MKRTKIKPNLYAKVFELPNVFRENTLRKTPDTPPVHAYARRRERHYAEPPRMLRGGLNLTVGSTPNLTGIPRLLGVRHEQSE